MAESNDGGGGGGGGGSGHGDWRLAYLSWLGPADHQRFSGPAVLWESSANRAFVWQFLITQAVLLCWAVLYSAWLCYPSNLRALRALFGWHDTKAAGSAGTAAGQSYSVLMVQATPLEARRSSSRAGSRLGGLELSTSGPSSEPDSRETLSISSDSETEAAQPLSLSSREVRIEIGPGLIDTAATNDDDDDDGGGDGEEQDVEDEDDEDGAVAPLDAKAGRGQRYQRLETDNETRTQKTRRLIRIKTRSRSRPLQEEEEGEGEGEGDGEED